MRPFFVVWGMGVGTMSKWCKVEISDAQKRTLLNDPGVAGECMAYAARVVGVADSLSGHMGDHVLSGQPGKVRFHARVATTTKRAYYRYRTALDAAMQSVMGAAYIGRGASKGRRS